MSREMITSVTDREPSREGKSIISLKEKMFFLSSTINIKFAVHFGEEPSKSLWFGVFGFCFTDKGDTALPEAVACFGDLKLFGEASATEGVCETVLLIFLLFFSSRLFFDVDARLKSCLPLISFFRASPLATLKQHQKPLFQYHLSLNSFFLTKT